MVIYISVQDILIYYVNKFIYLKVSHLDDKSDQKQATDVWFFVFVVGPNLNLVYCHFTRTYLNSLTI